MCIRDRARYERAQRLARLGQAPFARRGPISHLPGGLMSGWTAMRDLKPLPEQTFREWWIGRDRSAAGGDGSRAAS